MQKGSKEKKIWKCLLLISATMATIGFSHKAAADEMPNDVLVCSNKAIEVLANCYVNKLLPTQFGPQSIVGNYKLCKDAFFNTLETDCYLASVKEKYKTAVQFADSLIASYSWDLKVEAAFRRIK